MIGVVTTSYPRGPDDYAGAFVRDRVRSLVARGAQVEVLAAAPGDASCDDSQRGFEPDSAGSLRVIRIPAAPALFYGAGAPDALEAGGRSLLVSAAQFAARVTAALHERAPRWRSVESHWLVPSALSIAAVAPRLPHRAFAHGGDVALLERIPGGATLARWILAREPQLVFVSDDLRARFARLSERDPSTFLADVEPAPVDTRTFRPAGVADRRQTRAALGCQGAILFSAGRLVPIKGYDLLVRAVSRIPRARRPRVVIAGAGPERACLVRLARERGVSLELLGPIARTEVARWMSAADLYVQPSRVLGSGRSEGMPVSVREALAMGAPVVATAAGGLGALSAQVNLVPPDDLAALSAVIDAQLLALPAQSPAHLSTAGCAVEDALPPRHSM